MITDRPLRQEDVDYVKKNCLEGAVDKYGELIAPSEYCRAVLWNGEIVGVGGVVTYWSGVGEVWVMLSKKVLQIPVTMVRCIKRIYKRYRDDTNFTRLQCIVSANFPQGQKLVESLGFKFEGRLRKYLPDKVDAYIYSIVR